MPICEKSGQVTELIQITDLLSNFVNLGSKKGRKRGKIDAKGGQIYLKSGYITEIIQIMRFLSNVLALGRDNVPKGPHWLS